MLYLCDCGRDAVLDIGLFRSNIAEYEYPVDSVVPM